ncbi:MAG: RNB domain-containing ribonuclease, partial [Planctomycetota bacterium]
ATSVYLPDRTIPMFPRALAESRMSLDEGGDRPALSLLLELDAHGAILTHRITRSVIRVRHNLSYEEADAAIAAGREPLASLARLLEAEHRRRLAAGAVQVPGRDRTITPGRDGSVRIEVREQRTAASALVSEAMILANRLAAETLAKAGAPAIYRRQKLSGSPPEPASFPCTRVYAYHVRRKLGRTELGTEPGRHATLGIDHYVQVTSPIRRYQDLAMQRQLAAVVEGRAPVYDAQQVTEILRDTERATGDAGQATRETELYWVLEHVRQAPERRWEAIVLGPLRDRRVLLEIPALDLRTALKPGRRLAAGTRVELALASVHPRRGEYRFRITKVIATPPPRDETPEQTPEPHATSH